MVKSNGYQIIFDCGPSYYFLKNQLQFIGNSPIEKIIFIKNNQKKEKLPKNNIERNKCSLQ